MGLRQSGSFLPPRWNEGQEPLKLNSSTGNAHAIRINEPRIHPTRYRQATAGELREHARRGIREDGGAHGAHRVEAFERLHSHQPDAVSLVGPPTETGASTC